MSRDKWEANRAESGPTIAVVKRKGSSAESNHRGRTTLYIKQWHALLGGPINDSLEYPKHASDRKRKIIAPQIKSRRKPFALSTRFFIGIRRWLWVLIWGILPTAFKARSFSLRAWSEAWFWGSPFWGSTWLFRLRGSYHGGGRRSLFAYTWTGVLTWCTTAIAMLSDRLVRSGTNWWLVLSVMLKLLPIKALLWLPWTRGSFRDLWCQLCWHFFFFDFVGFYCERFVQLLRADLILTCRFFHYFMCYCSIISLLLKIAVRLFTYFFVDASWWFICLPCVCGIVVVFFSLENMIAEIFLGKGRTWILFWMKVMHFRLFEGKQWSFLGFGRTVTNRVINSITTIIDYILIHFCDSVI